MKSVGEAMSIGRTFAEALQKGLRSMETGLAGLDAPEVAVPDAEAMIGLLSQHRPDRILLIAEAFRMGPAIEKIAAACRYDKWFLEQIGELVAAEAEVKAKG